MVCRWWKKELVQKGRKQKWPGVVIRMIWCFHMISNVVIIILYSVDKISVINEETWSNSFLSIKVRIPTKYNELYILSSRKYTHVKQIFVTRFPPKRDTLLTPRTRKCNFTNHSAHAYKRMCFCQWIQMWTGGWEPIIHLLILVFTHRLQRNYTRR